MGLLVEALRDRGVEAYGIDLSQYAISKVRPDIAPYCRVASITDPIEGRYDLVTCIEVLEHVPGAFARQAIANLCGAADTVLFSSSPSDFETETHINVQPAIYWLRLFSEFDFWPDVLFDDGSIVPEAMLLRKGLRMADSALPLFSEMLRYKTALQQQQHRITALESEIAVRAAEQDPLDGTVGPRRLRCQVYWRFEAQFYSEARSSFTLTPIDMGLQSIRIPVGNDTDTGNLILRLDLSDRPAMARLSSLAVKAASGEVVWTWDGHPESLTRLRANQVRVYPQTGNRNGCLLQLESPDNWIELSVGAVAAPLRVEMGIAFFSGHGHLLHLQSEIDAVREQVVEVNCNTERLNESISSLAGQLPALEADLGQIEASVESLRRSQNRIQNSIVAIKMAGEQATHDIRSLYESRIWTSLTAWAAIVQKIQHYPALAAGYIWRRFSGGPAVEEAYLECDEPAAGDTSLRAGTLTVRGWAASASGIAGLAVRIGDGSRVQAVTGQVRVDVGKSVPLPDAARSGWFCSVDLGTLSDGPHELIVEAATRAGRALECRRTILIDHEMAFASGYDRWIKEFEQRDDDYIRNCLASFRYRPLVSIIVPVYKCSEEILTKTIASVRQQSYPDWELCIADDGSNSENLTRVLERCAQEDSRIKVTTLRANSGISAASNTALEFAHGEFVALLDHDDEYAPDALLHLVDALQRKPEADLLYSDEDKIDQAGRRYDPFFKPDWSPDLLMSMNYVCHLTMFRRSLLERTGAFRSEYDGSQDYDLILRLAEIARKIVHVPKVLYHWRSMPSSTATSVSEKDYSVDAGRRAIQSHLERTNANARVEPGLETGRWRVRHGTDALPQVSVIIASGGKADILDRNLADLFAKTEYGNFEVIIADNSRRDAIQKLVARWGRQHPVSYFDWRNQPFNYSVINNRAAERCSSPILLFLNDDTSVISPGWLQALVEQVVRPEVGAAGAKLLYPDGRIQHAGVVMGIFDNCGHAFKGLDGAVSHYFSISDVVRNVSAVTGACLMTRREVFHEVGGFDEQQFAVAFNDIDLCLKIRSLGYRIVYTPHALLYHYEAFSKTAKDLVPHPAEVSAMQAKWGDTIEHDPYYNPNLSCSTEDFSLRCR
jgi:GT2 family glycosyltransferase